jgi:phage-related protein (TIGR01555 family)
MSIMHITNSVGMTGLLDGVFNEPGMYNPQTISQPWTFANGVQYTPFTLNRIALSYGYMGYGLVQTLIDMPVEDAFRGGVQIKTDELDEEDLTLLYRFMSENGDFEAIQETLKWARLFGGAGLLIETEDPNTRTPLKPEKLKPDSVLRFIAADRWELVLTGTSILNLTNAGFGLGDVRKNEVPYMYYTQPLHESRVIKVNGKKAPSYIRLRLQGWGMSELERCIRDINSFIKFQNVIFELIDEAKIDIFKIQEFNSSLASAEGVELVRKRIALNSILKNYKNATVMDANDDFVQKQLAWSGLADIYAELRQNLSAALGIPEAKLFGQSSSGFSSGQDTIENYNALVESGVRSTSQPVIREVVKLRCQQLFGFQPEFDIAFKPLRVLSEPEEELMKTSKQNRALSLFDRQLYTGQEVLESLDKDNLINIESEVQQGLREVVQAVANEEQEANDEQRKENSLKIFTMLQDKAGKQREAFVNKDRKILSKLKRNAA